jgi:hypothetical protein
VLWKRSDIQQQELTWVSYISIQNKLWLFEQILGERKNVIETILQIEELPKAAIIQFRGKRTNLIVNKTGSGVLSTETAHAIS